MSAVGITAMNPEQIAELRAKARTKGLYRNELKNFLDSGLGGVMVSLEVGQFQGKKTATVKSGFENAKNGKDAPEGSDQVQVVVDGNTIYLINNALDSDNATEETEAAA